MKKAKFFKLFIVSITTLILLISLSAFLIYHYFPKDKLLNIITTKVEKALKRKLVIKKINYSLHGISLEDIILYNDLYSNNDDIPDSEILTSVKEANVRFLLLPLFDRQIIIESIVLNNLKTNIYYKDGKSNLANLFQDIKGKNNSQVKTKISFIRLNNAEITLNDSPKIFNPLKGKYFFTGTLYIPSDEKVSITDIEIALPEKRGKVFSDNLNIKIRDNNFELTGSAELENCSLLWVYKWRDGITLPYSVINGKARQIKITSESVEGSVSGEVVLKNSNRMDVDGSFKVDIPIKIISLSNIQAKIRNSSLMLNGLQMSYKTNIKNRILKFNTSSIHIYLNDFKPILTFLPINLFGKVTGDLLFENFQYNGNLKFKNLRYNKDNKSIFKINTEVNIKNNNLYKENVPIHIYSQPFSMSISASGRDLRKVVLNLSSKEFRFSTNDDKNSKFSFTPVSLNYDVSGRVDIDKFFIDKLELSSFVLNYSLYRGNLSLNRIFCKFMDGSVKANGNMDIFKSNPFVDISLAFENIKVQKIANLSKEYSGRFYGIASGKANLEFNIDKFENFYNSIKGHIEFSIDKGKLVNTGIQEGLGIWLSELKYKLRDLEFNKIYGNFNLLGKNCYINSILFNASDIRLKMNGYFSRGSKDPRKLPGEVRYVLEFNDKFISDIPDPAFLTRLQLNKYKKGGWYTRSFQGKGDDITDSKSIKPL